MVAISQISCPYRSPNRPFYSIEKPRPTSTAGSAQSARVRSPFGWAANSANLELRLPRNQDISVARLVSLFVPQTASFSLWPKAILIVAWGTVPGGMCGGGVSEVRIRQRP